MFIRISSVTSDLFFGIVICAVLVNTIKRHALVMDQFSGFSFGKLLGKPIKNETFCSLEYVLQCSKGWDDEVKVEGTYF